MKTINLIFPCSPNKFYFRSWNDGILRCCPRSAAQIVRTGDTAKYLVLHSAEVVHVHHCTHSTQTILYTLIVIRKRRRMRRDLSEAFSLPLWLDPFHLTRSTSACQAGESPRNIVDQARAYWQWLHWKQSSLGVLQISLSWVAVHKCTYSRNHRHGHE